MIRPLLDFRFFFPSWFTHLLLLPRHQETKKTHFCEELFDSNMGASTSTVPSSPAASSASTNSALPVGELTLVDDAYETKMAAFESDCNDGKGEALPCHQTAEFYSVVKEDRARSAKLYERNCREKGYPASCFNLGKLHLAGKGVPQDDATAEKLFAKACKGGHLSGCYHQGLLMYLAEQTKHQQTTPPQPKKLPTGPPSSSSAKSDDAAVPAAATAPAKKVRLTWRQADAIRLLEKTCAAGEHDSCYFAGRCVCVHAHLMTHRRLVITTLLASPLTTPVSPIVTSSTATWRTAHPARPSPCSKGGHPSPWPLSPCPHPSPCPCPTQCRRPARKVVTSSAVSSACNFVHLTILMAPLVSSALLPRFESLPMASLSLSRPSPWHLSLRPSPVRIQVVRRQPRPVVLQPRRAVQEGGRRGPTRRCAVREVQRADQGTCQTVRRHRRAKDRMKSHESRLRGHRRFALFVSYTSRDSCPCTIGVPPLLRPKQNNILTSHTAPHLAPHCPGTCNKAPRMPLTWPRHM